MNISETSPFPAGAIVFPYLRHSPGDTQSIESQEAFVLDWCRRQQLVVPRVFKDEARSGASTAGRDDFLAMIDTLRDQSLKPRPAGVLLWSFSRFARDYDDAEFYKADLRRRGYVIHSLTDQIPDGPFGRVIESITHWKDEERLREISKDSKRGLQWLAQQGYSVGGCPPRGYKKSQPIQVGCRKSGEPRLAHKWEIDPEYEGRAQLAWQLKIRGETNWGIHKSTRLYDSINCYPSFFRNVTYAGYRKCAALTVPNAHPAYVSKEEFDRIQAMHQPAQEGKPRGSAQGHPRQRAHNNDYLFTGIFYCGDCGSAMIGHTDTHSAAYRCGRSKQHGKESCHQPAIVAHAVHNLVLDWLSSDVLAYDHVSASRGLLIQQLQGVQSELEREQANLREELESVNRRIQNLMNALEEGGWSREVEIRVGERRSEKAQIELALGRVENQMKRGKVEVTDDALRYFCSEMNRQLRSENPAESRSVVQRVVKRVELKKEQLIIQHKTMLSEVTSQLHGYEKVARREFESLFLP